MLKRMKNCKRFVIISFFFNGILTMFFFINIKQMVAGTEKLENCLNSEGMLKYTEDVTKELAEDKKLTGERSEGCKSRPPYLIYVHETPEKYTHDLIKCTGYEFLNFKGFGKEFFRNDIMSVRDTWQFSLELIIHNNLLMSPYRTLNQNEAQVFYIPFYSALACFCGGRSSSLNIHEEFLNYVQSLESLKKGKPHVMSLGKIEREHAEKDGCKLLTSEIVKNITFIGIEQEVNENLREWLMSTTNPLIVAPYPSFGHLLPSVEMTDIKTMYENKERKIFMLFAGKGQTGAADNIRKKLVTGDVVKSLATTLTYDEYFKDTNPKENLWYVNIWFVYEMNVNEPLLSWMKNSVFCLQPDGDSPTRKSFYDSVVSGCIPVLFRYNYKVRYPFEDRINYDKFTVTINDYEVKDAVSVYNILKNLDEETIYRKQQYIYKVMKHLQYSYPLNNGTEDDAFQFILDEIAARFNITKL